MEIGLELASIILFTCFLTLSIVVNVLLRAVSINKSGKQMELSSSLWGTSISFMSLLVVIPVAFAQSGYLFGTHIISNRKGYLMLFAFTGASIIGTRYGLDVIQNIDTASAKHFSPSYTKTFIPIANSIRVVLDIASCWINYAITFTHLILLEIKKVLFDCVETDLQGLVHSIVNFVGSIFQSIFVFFNSFFAYPMDLKTPTQKLGIIIDYALDPFVCGCQDLNVLYKIANTTVNSVNLADTVNSTGAIIFYIIKPTIQFVKALFLDILDPFPCTGNETEILACRLGRPPKYDITGNVTCDALVSAGMWTDDIIEAIIQDLFDIEDISKIPKFGAFASAPLCSIVQAAIQVVDISFHVDLIFEPSVNYFEYANITFPFAALYPLSTALEGLLAPVNKTEAVSIGCALGNWMNMTIEISTFLIKFVQKVITNPTGVELFFQDYPYDNLRYPWQKFIICTLDSVADLFDAENRTNVMLSYGFNATDQAFFSIYDLIIHYKVVFADLSAFAQYINGTFRANVNKAFDYSVIFCIAANNVVRGFDKDHCTPAVLQVSWQLPDVGDGNDGFFCCLGNVVQVMFQGSLAITIFITNAVINIVTLIGNLSGASVKYVIVNMVSDIEDKLQFILEGNAVSSACMMAAPFSTVNCTNSKKTGENLGDQVYNFTMFMNAPLILGVEFVDFVLGIVVDVIDDPEILIEDVFCNGTGILYDATIGFAAEFIANVISLGACVLDDKLDEVSKEIYRIFVSPHGIKHIVCEAVHIIITVIELLYDLFSGHVGDFAKTLIGLIPGLADAVNGVARLICYIGKLPGRIAACFHKTFDICLFKHCLKIPDIFADIDCVFHIVSLKDDTECNNKTITKRSEEYFSYYYEEEREDIIEDFYREENERYGFNISSILDFGFTNDTTSPCYPLSEFLQEEGQSEWLKQALIYEYRKCITAVGIARFLNNRLGDSYISDDTFYDILSFVNTTTNIGQRLAPVLVWLSQNQIFQTFNNSWEEYRLEYGINDTMAIKFGDTVSKYINNENLELDDTDSFISYLLAKLFTYIKIFGYDAWFSDHGLFSFFRRVLADFSTRDPQVLVNIYNNMTFDPRIKEVYNMTVEKGVNMIRDTKEYVYDIIRPKTYKTYRNRKVLFDLAKKTTQVIGKITLQDEEYIQENERWMDEDVGMYVFGERSKRDIGVGPCELGLCINCSILTNILDTMVDNLDTCVGEMVDVIYNISENYIKDPDHVYIKPSWDIIKNYPYQQRINSSESGLAINILKFPNYPFEKITGVDLFQISNVIATFFTYTNENDSNSYEYWIQHFVNCDFKEDLICRYGEPGFGLYYGLIMTSVLFLLITIMITISPIGNNVFILLLLWSFFPMITFVLSYRSSPSCGNGIPDCLWDDIYAGLKYFDGDCINWNRFFPGITTDACPDEASNFTRPFTNCSDENSFAFSDSGFRNLFYLLERHQPSVNRYIRESNSNFATTLRGIKAINDSVYFPFEGPDLPEEYQAYEGCHRISILSLAVPSTTSLFSGIGGVLSFYLLLLSVYLIVKVITDIFVLAMMIIASSTAVTGNRTNVFKYKWEVPKINYNNNNGGGGNYMGPSSSSGGGIAGDYYSNDAIDQDTPSNESNVITTIPTNNVRNMKNKIEDVADSTATVGGVEDASINNNNNNETSASVDNTMITNPVTTTPTPTIPIDNTIINTDTTLTIPPSSQIVTDANASPQQPPAIVSENKTPASELISSTPASSRRGRSINMNTSNANSSSSLYHGSFNISGGSNDNNSNNTMNTFSLSHRKNASQRRNYEDISDGEYRSSNNNNNNNNNVNTTEHSGEKNIESKKSKKSKKTKKTKKRTNNNNNNNGSNNASSRNDNGRMNVILPFFGGSVSSGKYIDVGGNDNNNNNDNYYDEGEFREDSYGDVDV